MDILRKGSLVVTTVVSVVILLMGNAVADINQEKLVTSVKLSPPPGPFFKGTSSIASKKDALVAPIAPLKPVSNLQRPELKANSLEFKMHPPKLKKTDFKEPKLTSPPVKKIIEPVMQQSVPKLLQKISKTPSNHQMPQSHIKKPSLVSSPNAPIWMQRGGLVNQRPNGAINSKSQDGKAGVQYKNYNGMPNMGWNYPHPVQQYMYVPVPMMIPSTVPRQMPLAPSFNYGAKMPFYNNIPLGNNDNRAVDKSVIPVQKEDK